MTMVAEMERLRRLIGSSYDAPAFLDYGSGFGRWARAAVKAGFKVTAVEPSMARALDKEAPFELIHEAARLRGRRFAAIQLEQVLEHIPDPLPTLQELKPLCTPDTVIRITVPNILRGVDGNSLWATWPFDGTSPHILAPYEHLHGFTSTSLDALLGRACFTSISRIKLSRHYPAIQIRSLLQRVIPSLGSTVRLVSHRLQERLVRGSFAAI
jgi:SAM-dependent methyltransferase